MDSPPPSGLSSLQTDSDGKITKERGKTVDERERTVRLLTSEKVRRLAWNDLEKQDESVREEEESKNMDHRRRDGMKRIETETHLKETNSTNVNFDFLFSPKSVNFPLTVNK